jgi:hypothetical protein
MIGFFLFATVSSPAVESHPASCLMLSAKVKNVCSYNATPPVRLYSLLHN